jgi:hypothetical protein
MDVDGRGGRCRRLSSRSPGGRIASFGWLTLLVAGSPGCSYGFVHGPPGPAEISAREPPQAQAAKPDCTSSNAVPILDTVLAVPLIGAGVLAIVAGASNGSSNGWYSGPTSGETIGIGLAATALGTLFLSSAITGYGRTADCRRAEEALPTGPRPMGRRHLLDVEGIARVRAQEVQGR